MKALVINKLTNIVENTIEVQVNSETKEIINYVPPSGCSVVLAPEITFTQLDDTKTVLHLGSIGDNLDELLTRESYES